MIERRFSQIREWMTSKAAFQILAVLLAITAWAFVNSGRTFHQIRTVKIQYVQIPQGLVFQRQPMKEVKIDLLGSLYRLRSIKDDDLVYLVDLAHARPGILHVEIDPDSLRLPLEVEALHVIPRSFNVHLEEVYEKEVLLKPVYVGKLKDGFEVTNLRMVPEVVTVTGPASVVSKIDEVPVEVPLEGRDSSFSAPVQPKLNYPDTSTSDSVLLEVEVSPIRTTRELADVPVMPSPSTPAVHVTPSTAQVTIQSSPKSAFLLKNSVRVTVPVEGLKRGRYRIRGTVEAPPEIRVLSLEPQTFIVEVDK